MKGENRKSEKLAHIKSERRDRNVHLIKINIYFVLIVKWNESDLTARSSRKIEVIPRIPGFKR